MPFAAALPALRNRIASDVKREGLPREKVLATIVSLLESTFIRMGNVEYAAKNKSYGLTTMRRKHVAIDAASCDSSSPASRAKCGMSLSPPYPI